MTKPPWIGGFVNQSPFPYLAWARVRIFSKKGGLPGPGPGPDRARPLGPALAAPLSQKKNGPRPMQGMGTDSD